jgi:hypothetical protein
MEMNRLAKLEINRNKFTTNPPDFVSDPPDPAVAEPWEGPGWIARPHIQNWLDGIKTRQPPNADVEIGHRSISVCHLANIARQVGRRLRWDPDRETFPDDDQANAYVDRPRRGGLGAAGDRQNPLDGVIARSCEGRRA